MSRQSFIAVSQFLLLGTLLSGAMTARAQSRPVADELGLSGSVLAPDGTPVSSGRVILVRSPASRVTTAIDREGRFRFAPDAPGPHQLVVATPGFAPYRVNISVPPSRTVRLPAIHLSPATYFRARFVTATGEPITSPTLPAIGGHERPHDSRPE